MRRFSIVWLLAACGCVGDIGDRPPDPTCSIEAGEAPLRRLTRQEYNNTIRDLLNDDSGPADAWLPDPIALGFDNNAKAQVVSFQLAEQFVASAEAVAATAMQNLALPCAEQTSACAREFIDDFVPRAYRRPLTDDDRARLMGVFGWGLSEDGFDTGIRLVLETVLQSPHFLYRVELTGVESGELVRLDDYAIATRLSYLLWGSMPDAELFDSASRGELHTREQVRAQAERMLLDWRARDALANFTRQWALLDEIDDAEKDPQQFPLFSEEVKPFLKQGTTLFVDHVTFASDKGDFEELMTASYVFANAQTAPLWGTSAAGDDFQRVDVDPAQRAGIVTDLAWLTALAKYDQSHPVARGVFVREHLLCQTLPNPPDNVEIEIPMVDPNSTTRERFSQHSADPSCAGCHELIDPLGFGFEHYDAVGMYRDTENGKPVDASGSIVQTEDLDGPFDGAVELAHKLAASSEVRRCFATQWYRYAFGRGETPSDGCTIDDLHARWGDRDFNLRELLIALTQTDAFFYRRPFPEEECTP
ncbi:MAG TPA: DUF1592 domain-containing protein [Polyangiaceae bacterium]|nr:DUF1592 domain-containing protein [Polyangiaceae bacterium]